MKQGRTIQELAAELGRQRDTRKDYVAPQGVIEAVLVDDKQITLAGINGQAYGITDHAHGQFADHLAIPRKYYDRMHVEHPALLTANLNGWLKKAGNEKRMIRTLRWTTTN